MWIVYLVFGTVFGWTLSRSGAADYDFIQKMFLFQDFQLYGIMGVAVVVTAPGIWLLKRRGKTLSGQAVDLGEKPSHRGNIVGGILFGVGWSITGMCPGPILVNIGEGKLYVGGLRRHPRGRRAVRLLLPGVRAALAFAGARAGNGRRLTCAPCAFPT